MHSPLRVAQVAWYRELIDEVKGPGVLDVCWRQQPDKAVRGLWASSDGCLQLTKAFSIDTLGASLTGHDSFLVERDRIAMACDMSVREGKLTAAMSSGTIGIVDISSGTVQGVKGHSSEAWTVTFDPHNDQLLFSGGDDGCWKCWDMRDSAKSLFSNSWHTAGVCSIQPHSVNPERLVTGSYDKRIALWDRRNLQTPLHFLDRAAESGIWKLRWHPSGDFRVLAACMYDGFYVYNLAAPRSQEPSESDRRAGVEATYDPKDLSYGCAWLNSSTALTCSFYNHQMQIWSVNSE